MPANRAPLHRSLLVVWLSASLLGGSPALAEQLYRWVDDQGQTHFSDTPPGDAAKDRAVQSIPMPSASAPAQTSPADGRYSITSQLEWMRQDRERREAARRQEAAIQLERDRLQVQEAEARARAAEAAAARAQTPTYVYPLWPRVPPRFPHRHDQSDRQDRPSRDDSDTAQDRRSLTRPGLSLTRPGLSLEPPQ